MTKSLSEYRRQQKYDRRIRRRDSIMGSPAARMITSPLDSPRGPRLRPIYRPIYSVDLEGRLHRQTHIPEHEMSRTRQRMGSADHDRGPEVCRREHRLPPDRAQVRQKDKQIEDLTKQLEEEKSIVRDLRKEKEASDQEFKDLEEITEMGYKTLAGRNDDFEALQRDFQQLHLTADGRKDEIASLNERILRLTMAPPEKWMGVALETQANRTLGMVKGLRKEIERLRQDVATRDLRITRLQQDVVTRDSEVKGLQKGAATRDTEIKRLRDVVGARNSEVKGLKDRATELTTTSAGLAGELDEMRASNREWETASKVSSKKLADARGIVEEQQSLINKLLEANTRLGAK